MSTDPAAPALPDPTAEQDAGAAASPPVRKPRATRAKATAPEPAPAAAAPAAPEAVKPPSPGEGGPTESPAETFLRREQFARLIGYRPAELISFERKGWLRPAKRENGVSLYNKAEAQEIRQDLRRRLQEEADQTRRKRRY